MAAGDRKESGSFFKNCKFQKGREDVRGKERRGGGEEGKEGRRWRSTGHVGRRVFHKNCWNCWKVPEEFSSSHHKKCKKSLRNSRWAIAANFFLPTSLWPQVCCAGVQEVERCCWELEAVGGQKACSWRRREHDIVLCCGSGKEEKNTNHPSYWFVQWSGEESRHGNERISWTERIGSWRWVFWACWSFSNRGSFSTAFQECISQPGEQ